MPTMSFGRLSNSNGRPRARVYQAGLASPHLPGETLGRGRRRNPTEARLRPSCMGKAGAGGHP
jgi:hypothetical protein